MVSLEQVLEIIDRESQERAVALSPERVSLSSAVGRIVAEDILVQPENPAPIPVENDKSEGVDDIPSAQAAAKTERIIARQGDTFSLGELLIAAEAKISEVAVARRLSVGLLIISDNPEGSVEPYASLLNLTAPDLGIVVSEVARVVIGRLGEGLETEAAATMPESPAGEGVAAESSTLSANRPEVSTASDSPLTAQIERLIGLELDCIVVLSETPSLVRSSIESAGGWVLFDQPDIWPLGDTLFGTFRGRRSVIFSLPHQPIAALSAFRFLVGPYVARVAGARHRAPVRASLAHLVEKGSEKTELVLGELVARRGEFLITIIPASMSLAVSSSASASPAPDSPPSEIAPSSDSLARALARASCWAVLPAGRTLFDRGDLVDLYSITPAVGAFVGGTSLVGRTPLVRGSEGEVVG